MTRLSKNAKRMMAVAMSAALAFSGITVQNADAATSKLAVAKSVTVAKGATKNLAIKATGFTVKSVKVKVKGKAATAKATKKTVSVTGVKVGTATVTTTIKAIKKGKKAKTYTFTTAVKVTKAKTPAKVTSAEVSTQEELVEALKNKSLKKLTIGQKATTLEIPEGTYENVDLIVDAPNASITNYATFKSIEIKAVAANTFKEKGKNNRLNVTAKKEIHLIIDTIYEVLSLVFKGTAADAPKGASLVEMVSGVLKNMDVTNGDKVDMTASGESKIGGINASEGAQLNLKASGSVTVDEITLKGDGTKGAITSDGNSNVKNVKMGEGKVESSISGDSKNVTTLDITEATKDAKATLNTDSVKISTDENTSVKDVVDNQSGKPVVTETQKSDGTVDTGTKPADGNSGVKQPSGGGGGSDSGGSSVTYYTVTLREQSGCTIDAEEAVACGFSAGPDAGTYVKAYVAGSSFGSLPKANFTGGYFCYWCNDEDGWTIMSDSTVRGDCSFHALVAKSIEIEYDTYNIGTAPATVTYSDATKSNTIPDFSGTSALDFSGWKMQDRVFDPGTTIEAVVSYGLQTWGGNDHDGWQTEDACDKLTFCLEAEYTPKGEAAPTITDENDYTRAADSLTVTVNGSDTWQFIAVEGNDENGLYALYGTDNSNWVNASRGVLAGYNDWYGAVLNTDSSGNSIAADKRYTVYARVGSSSSNGIAEVQTIGIFTTIEGTPSINNSYAGVTSIPGDYDITEGLNLEGVSIKGPDGTEYATPNGFRVKTTGGGWNRSESPNKILVNFWAYDLHDSGEADEDWNRAFIYAPVTVELDIPNS